MSNSTRAEHLAWCKTRALAYLPGDPSNALASMMSDLGKHPETADHIGITLGMQLLVAGFISNSDPAEVRKFIEGFN